MKGSDKATCHAHSRSGQLCSNTAMPGQKVCRFHGGESPQALGKARERLLELVSPALAQLTKIVDDTETPPAVRLQAIRDILDRVGLGAKQQIDLEAGASVTFTLELPKPLADL